MSSEATTAPGSTAPGGVAFPVGVRLRHAVADAARGVWAVRLEIALVAGITLVAAVIRLWHLGTVPLGLHGDEAWSGLDARDIEHNGWIGPYNIHALGQPLGPLYFTALLFRFFPETTSTIRFSMAIWGVLTIPVTYLAFRSMFDRTIGAFSALLLAVMTWHFHLSRTGFMVTTWPFVEMLALWLLWLALRRRSPWLWIAGGLVAGAGVYTYNAYLLFLPVLFVPIAWTLVAARTRRARVNIAAGALLACIAGLLVAWPLIDYVRDNTFTYRYHQRIVGVQHSQKWKDAGVTGKADILWDRGIEWGTAIAKGDRPDLGDGLATKDHPVVDPLMLSLACIGTLMALWRIRRAEYATVLAAIPLMLPGALLTVLDGLFRRTFGMTPFIALLAALPLAWAWRRMAERRDAAGYAVCAMLLVAVVGMGVVNTRAYFGPVQRSQAITFTYPYQLDEASRYIATLPKDTEIYFYSDRWSMRYETRVFLAPGYAHFADRSREFRALQDRNAPVDLSADRSKRVAFVFLGAYLNELDRVTAIYPGGLPVEGRRRDEVTFRAYSLEPENAP